jgi:hypothetical protein
MTAITRRSGVGGEWSTAADWSSDSAPSGTDDVTISATGHPSYNVAVSSAETAHSLPLTAVGATLVVSSTLAIGTAFTISAAGLGLAGTGILQGGMVVTSGAATVFADPTAARMRPRQPPIRVPPRRQAFPASGISRVFLGRDSLRACCISDPYQPERQRRTALNESGRHW